MAIGGRARIHLLGSMSILRDTGRGREVVGSRKVQELVRRKAEEDWFGLATAAAASLEFRLSV